MYFLYVYVYTLHYKIIPSSNMVWWKRVIENGSLIKRISGLYINMSIANNLVLVWVLYGYIGGYNIVW